MADGQLLKAFAFNSNVTDANGDRVLDANSNVVVVEGNSTFALTATGAVSAVAGEVDQNIGDFSLNATGTVEGATVDVGIGDFGLTVSAWSPRNAAVDQIMGAFTLLATATTNPGGGGRGSGKSKPSSKKKSADAHAEFIERAVEEHRRALLKKVRAKKAEKTEEEDEEITDEELDLIIQALHERQEAERVEKRSAFWSKLVSMSKH